MTILYSVLLSALGAAVVGSLLKIIAAAVALRVSAACILTGFFKARGSWLTVLMFDALDGIVTLAALGIAGSARLTQGFQLLGWTVYILLGGLGSMFGLFLIRGTPLERYSADWYDDINAEPETQDTESASKRAKFRSVRIFGQYRRQAHERLKMAAFAAASSGPLKVTSQIFQTAEDRLKGDNATTILARAGRLKDLPREMENLSSIIDLPGPVRRRLDENNEDADEDERVEYLRSLVETLRIHRISEPLSTILRDEGAS